MIPRRLLRLSLASAAAALGGSVLPATGASAQDIPIEIHGYVNQAIGMSSDLPVLGVGKRVTTDQRRIALQVQAALSPEDRVVVKLGHRRLGVSANGLEDPDFGLAWAFYEHRFGSTAVRVGKQPMAIGLLNGLRDAGTALPFYRAPRTTYEDFWEGASGVSVTRPFALPGSWSMDAQFLVGESDARMGVQTPVGATVERVKISPHVTGSLMLNSPSMRTKVGALVASQTYDTLSLAGPGEHHGLFRMFSAQHSMGPVTLQGELTTLGVDDRFSRTGWYAQASFHATEKTSLHTQYSADRWNLYGLPGPVSELSFDMVKHDIAVGVSHATSPNVLLKLEAHRYAGFDFDTFTDITGAAKRTNYVIASVAIGF